MRYSDVIEINIKPHGHVGGILVWTKSKLKRGDREKFVYVNSNVDSISWLVLYNSKLNAVTSYASNMMATILSTEWRHCHPMCSYTWGDSDVILWTVLSPSCSRDTMLQHGKNQGVHILLHFDCLQECITALMKFISSTRFISNTTKETQTDTRHSNEIYWVAQKSKIYLISVSFFLVLNHDFIVHIDFNSITASNRATDDVIN